MWVGLKQRGEKDKTILLSHLPLCSSAVSLIILAQAQCGDRLSVGSICEAGISAFSRRLASPLGLAASGVKTGLFLRSSLSLCPKRMDSYAPL